MPTTYEAILRGNVIEWRTDAPQPLSQDRAINVHVTVLDDSMSSSTSQGQRMAAALEELAQSQTLADVDAAKWERETRADRPLPGHEE